jgi:hypothetical protein
MALTTSGSAFFAIIVRRNCLAFFAISKRVRELHYNVSRDLRLVNAQPLVIEEEQQSTSYAVEQ